MGEVLRHPLRFVVIYLLLVACACIVNYPGRLSPDSWDVLTQSYIDRFSNWHPPLVAVLWELPGWAVGQPFGALFVQTALLLFYPAALIASGVGNRRVGYVVFAGILIAVAGAIGKDVMILGCILLLLWSIQRGYLTAMLAAALVIVLSRQTNIVMLALSAAIIVFLMRATRPLMKIGIIWCLLLCMIPIFSYLNKKIFQSIESHPEQSLIIFDVAGISTVIRHDLFSTLPGWPKDIAPPWECYEAASWDVFAWGACGAYASSLYRTTPGTSKQPKRLAEPLVRKMGPGSIIKWWLKAIIDNPAAYLSHRTSHAISALSGIYPIVHWRRPYATNSADADRSGVETWSVDMDHIFGMWEHKTMFVPFGIISYLTVNRYTVGLALLSCLLTLVMSARNRACNERLLIAAASIGLSNFLMYFFFGVASDARYLLPTFACGYLCAVTSLTRPYAIVHHAAPTASQSTASNL